MNIADVMDELGDALDGITGLRVYPYSADRITPPAAIVGWPDSFTYDAAYQRGADRFTIPVTVMAGKVVARTARDDLARFADGSGTDSVKQVLEAATYTAFDSLRVQSVEFEAITVAAVEYLSATFSVDIIGQGG